MHQDQALELIKHALVKAVPQAANCELQPQTHLIKDGIMDSLDSMAFLYELEALCGGPLQAITDDFTDFRVQRLIDIVQQR